MALNPNFPTDPHAILDPDIRWYPGEEKYSEDGYATLLPPLVYEIRKKVKSWRATNYGGASHTTRALLNHWFNTEHLLPQENGNLQSFQYYFCQREANGAIFVQTISDYPLVEAIRQGIVKTPVLPDAASRAKLSEKQSSKFSEQYEDYLRLGYLEWKKVYEELKSAGKKSVLFVMTDDTKNCDEVGEYLKSRYKELSDGVLVIHTKKNGEISEAASGKSKEELEELRKLSRQIDQLENPFKAIVSVMVLREGWDVQNVVALVGLRPYKAKSQILPEQTLGRGLRRMFRGQPVVEKVSVVGTSAFMDFVESIKNEGVELEYAPMGGKSQPKSPLVVDLDNDNESKDISNLDI